MKGLLLCLVLTGLAFMLMHLPFAPFTLSNGVHPVEGATLALILGLILAPWLRGKYAAGFQFAKKHMLSLGVILIGTQLNVRMLSHLPLSLIGVMLALVVIILGLGFLLGRLFKVPLKASCLVGLGTAICGSSAMMAGQVMIQAEESELAVSLAAINILGLLLIFILPLIAHAIGMNAPSFGVFSGLSVQAVPQVIAAALTFGMKSAPMATLVKLVRVLMLGPVLFVLKVVMTLMPSKATAQQGDDNQSFLQKFFGFVPPFILLFFVAVLLGGYHGLDQKEVWLSGHSARQIFWFMSQGCLAMALVAIGLSVNFKELRRMGRPILLLALVLAVILLALSVMVALHLGHLS